MWIMHAAIRADTNIPHHNALIFGLARFLRKLRLRSGDRSRCAYAIAHVKYSRTYAGPPCPDPTPPPLPLPIPPLTPTPLEGVMSLESGSPSCMFGGVDIGNHRRLDHQLTLLLNQYSWRSELLLRRFRRRTSGRLQFAGIPATSAAGAAFSHFHRYVRRKFH